MFILNLIIILKDDDDNCLIYDQILNISLIQGNFLIDTTLGRDTVFGVFVEDDENHHIKAVTFRDTEG